MVAVGRKNLLVRMIELYQRHLSPRKGFRCAHRVAHGGRSCSEFGRRVAARRGMSLSRWSALMRKRFTACAAAAATLRSDARRSDHRPVYESCDGADSAEF